MTDRWPRPAPAGRVLTECLAAVRDGRAPGCIGVTNPERADAVRATLVADPTPRTWWTEQRITQWRSEETAHITGLLHPPSDPFPYIAPLGAAEVARSGLALCDDLVRDQLLAAAAHTPTPGREAAAHRLHQISDLLPAAVRAPAATALAVLDFAEGRPVTDLLAWGTQATADYRLAGLLTELEAAGADGAVLLTLLGTIPATGQPPNDPLSHLHVDAGAHATATRIADDQPVQGAGVMTR